MARVWLPLLCALIASPVVSAAPPDGGVVDLASTRGGDPDLGQSPAPTRIADPGTLAADRLAPPAPAPSTTAAPLVDPALKLAKPPAARPKKIPFYARPWLWVGLLAVATVAVVIGSTQTGGPPTATITIDGRLFR